MSKVGLNSKIKLPDFQELRERYRQLSEVQLKEAAEECAEKASDYFYDNFHKGLARHIRTGGGIETLQKARITQKMGGVFVGEVGCFDTTNRKVFLHVVWQEYGGGHFKADPWFRPVVDRSKTKLKKEFEKIFEKHTGGEFK